MKFTPGIWNIQKKEDWIYIINLLGLNPDHEKYWDEYKINFCANINFHNGNYSFSYSSLDWYLNNNFFVTGVYVRNEYEVNLI